jgi:WD40 repeat protein
MEIFEVCRLPTEGQWMHYRQLQFSPDGSCILAANNRRKLSLVGPLTDLHEFASIQETESITDFEWYPLAVPNSESSTLLFATTSKDQPVHLWDASTRALRASYSTYNQFDEVSSALSLCFDAFGTNLYCGLVNRITCFDVAKPGREYSEIQLKDQVPGLISVVSHCKSANGTALLAFGSFNGGVGLIDTRNQSVWCRLDQGVHRTGVTDIKFRENTLITGGRRADFLLHWDVRNLSSPLRQYKRKCSNNQRMFFDIDPSGRYLMSGDQSGYIHLFDLNEAQEDSQEVIDFKEGTASSSHLICKDGRPVNCVSFSPQSSSSEGKLFIRCALSTGERQLSSKLTKLFKTLEETDSDNDDDESLEEPNMLGVFDIELNTTSAINISEL